MTDSFYYNCLVPDALLPKGTSSPNNESPGWQNGSAGQSPSAPGLQNEQTENSARCSDQMPPPRPPRWERERAGDRWQNMQQSDEPPPRPPKQEKERAVPKMATHHGRSRSEPIDDQFSLPPVWERKSVGDDTSFPPGWQGDNMVDPSFRWPSEQLLSHNPHKWEKEPMDKHVSWSPKLQNDSVDKTRTSACQDEVSDDLPPPPPRRMSIDKPVFEPPPPTPRRASVDKRVSWSPRYQNEPTIEYPSRSSGCQSESVVKPVEVQLLKSVNVPDDSHAERPSPKSPQWQDGGTEDLPGVTSDVGKLIDRQSYEYPPTSPRRHEFHQGHPPRQSSADSEAGFTEKQSSMGVSALRPSSSFKDKSSRTQSAFVGAATQPLPISTSPLVQPEILQLQTASSQLQRRSLPTPSRAIAEEGENADNASVLRLDLGHSNITETNSHSIESLDEVDSVQEVRFDDVELGNLDTDEPETWSETADKKILKKMPPKDIKRQDTIWELIQTERLYCKRLKTLQIFFHDGMLHELHWPIKLVERMFPHLDDLIYIHMNFLQQLQDLQNKRADRGVDELGATLKEQFSGESAEQMKSAYGAFCSGHLDAVQLYKDQIAKDRKFQNFIKARSNHHLCKKREIPDFILLITQRTTKYPILIEAIIKSTKDKKDRENLSKALEMSKGVLKSVDETVSAAERRMRLRDIYHRLDSRSWAQHRGKKFKKQDLTAGGRKLLHEGVVSWKNARGKSVDVLAVVLTDVLFFLQENNQKYSFFSQDNKNGVVSLFNLLVREKRDTRDTKGIYLISQNKQSPEMYEIVFNIMSDMQKWAKILRLAVEQCPEEEDEVPTEAEEERRKMEEKVEKAQVIMEKLRSKDEEIRACCDSKNKLMIELLAVYNDTEEQHNSRPNSLDFEETSTAENSGTLQAAIQEVSNAASQLTSMLQGTGTNLSRSVSSVGEHNSHTFTVVPIPKRAETFAGFDNSHDTHRVAAKKSNEDVADFSESPQGGYRGQELSESDLIQYGDITPNSYPKGFEGEADSGCGSSLGGFSSASTLSPMSSVSASQEQSNVAHLLRTLNSIVHLTASQGTAVETLRAQLAEANERINKLSVDVHEKKSGYRHNQLEELRNLQGVIQKEKEEWEVKKEKETYAMEHERLHLEEMRKSLEKQESDLKQHKEEFNKKREVLQLQMDMLRKTGQLPRGTALMGATSSESDTDKADNVVQATADFVPSHKRSASAESFNASNDQTKTTGSSAATSNKDQSSRSEQRPTVSKQSFSFGHKQNLPIHLLSAKNEQKVGSKNVQKIPSKLLSSSATGSQSTSSLQTVTQPGLRNTSPSGGGQGGSQGNGGNQSIPANLHEAGTGHVDSKLGHSSSAGSIGNHANSGKGQQPGTSVTVPKGNWQSNRPSKPGSSAGISALLKLSEKGDKKDKKGSSSSQGGARSTPPKNEKQAHQRPKSGVQGEQNTNSNHKSQKSESDVIYF